MAILNESMGFDDLTPEQQRSFAGGGGRVTKVLLAANTRLRKLVSEGGRFNPYSAYWMLQEDWELYIEKRLPAGVSSAAATKARLAVSEDFQPNLERRLYARLLQQVWAFRGPARHQPISAANSKVVLIGGAPQVVIPGLTRSHIMVLHPVN